MKSVRIVIFSGGTGSIALQRGLYQILDQNIDGVDTKIIVNAYDNGLSTGAVRRVMDGRILGPSDVRKNQVTRLQLMNPSSPWLKFLNDRFTISASKARSYCNEKVLALVTDLERDELQSDCRDTLFAAIEEFFSSSNANQIEYNDFSLANIIYAGVAKANGYSLRAAATRMAHAMAIPDCVLLNDDKSLFLGAITASGKRVADEGEIVSWDDETDPFVNLFFYDVDGHEGKPELCLEAWRAILEADLIILAPGTQWSSLIPTYASVGFKKAINSSRAKVLMVMNRRPDRDSPSQSASDIINILVPQYFDYNRLHVLADENGHPAMRGLTQSAVRKVASFTHGTLSTAAEPIDKHDGDMLASAIGRTFFADHLQSDYYLFDYDDTLVCRDNKYSRSSKFNRAGISLLNSLANVGVCTGNTIREIDLRADTDGDNALPDLTFKPLVIFADGGANKYLYDARPLVNQGGICAGPVCILPEALLSEAGPRSVNQIITALERAGVPASKIDYRGKVIIAIKPVDKEYRRTVLTVVKCLIEESDLEARERGKTTVEICRSILSKSCAVKYLRGNSPPLPRITYVGDELESGNDRDIRALSEQDPGVTCLHVDSPAKTAFFISTLLAYLSKHAKH